MPKIVDINQMKLDLYEAYKTCTNEKPINDVTMRDIAKKAGVTHPTVVKYFPDKSDFIAMYIDELKNEYMSMLTDLYNSKKRYNFDLQIFLIDLTGFLFDIDGQLNCDDKFLQIYYIAQIDNKIKIHVKKYYDDWINFINKVLEVNDIPRSKQLSETIFMWLEGIFIMAINTGMTKDDAIRMCNRIKLVE